MKPKTRLIAVLLAAAALSIVIAAGLLYANLRRTALAASERDARLHMAAAVAVRQYTDEQVAPFVAREGLGFDPIAIPSHAATATMKLFERELPGQQYREAVLQPTNPEHRAAGWSADIVHELRRTGEPTLTRLTGEPGHEMLHHARALRVDSERCLACHGSAGQMPASVRERWGVSAGTGWRLGEVVGAQIVTTSVAAATTRLWPTFTLSMASTSAALGVVFLTLNLMLHRLVLRPAEVRTQELRRLALRDSLTGAANRRRFMDELSRRIAECDGQHLPLSVVMLDLDHFKAVNDQYGHATGDQVLQETVRRMRRRIRKGDLVGRLGGEEFAVLLPDADGEGARAHAEHVLRSLSGRPFDVVGRVTASLGVAQWNGRETAAALLMRADAALYLAKRSGRARVVVAPELLDSVDLGLPGLI